MPRRSAPSDHSIVRIRAWLGLGLTRADLALYLGVSKALIQGLEADTHRLTPRVSAALLPLLRLLPTPPVQAAAEAEAAAQAALPAPDALPPGTSAPDPADLDFRRRACRAHAARLLAQAAALAHRARVAHRWAGALPALLPPDPADPATAPYYAALPPDPDPDAPTRAREHATWLRRWLPRRAQPLPTEAATRYHRLRAQAAGLLAEAAAL